MGLMQPFSRFSDDVPVRSARRAPRRHRLAGLIAALLLEALVVLALLTLGSGRMTEMAKEGVPLKTFDLAVPSPEPEVPVKVPEKKVAKTQPVPQPRAVPTPDVPAPQVAPVAPAPAPQPTPLVVLKPSEMAAADLRSMPSAAKPAKVYGPAAPSTAADTPLVDGSGPNGERLYAAAWQREPSDGELRGYLSTATPGWATIACRTVADFRVDDCVAVAEYPRGSQMARAVLAAAWQFRVRPPRIGGQLQVGEWVRIRIDYEVRRRNAWEKAGG